MLHLWPLSALQRRRYQRRYAAAWTLLLARYTFSRLTPAQQNEVRQRDVQYLMACGSFLPFIREYLRTRFFPDYVIAMKSLGIAPALEGEQWPIPANISMPVVDPSKRFHFPPRGSHRVLNFALKLRRDFNHEDPATEDARRDLAGRGIRVIPMDFNSLDEVHHLRMDGRFVTWREWWRSHP